MATTTPAIFAKNRAKAAALVQEAGAILRGSIPCCEDCAKLKVAQHYPWKKCVQDGKDMGLSQEAAERRCKWIACCRSKRQNRFKETGACDEFDCSKTPKGVDRQEGDEA